MDDKRSSSRVFSPSKALGLFNECVPPCFRHHVKYNETYVITSVGKAFQIYNTSKLGIVSVSDLHEEPICCLAADSTLVFTASRDIIQAFSRGHVVSHVYKGHQSPVHLLLPFGQHLISVDETSALNVWDIESEELVMELTFDNNTFTITALVHPSCYVNKLLLGSRQGELQLWNIRTAKLLYTFPGWGHSVTVLEQAPSIDVIAVGLSSGSIYLHNIKFDETVVKLHQGWGPVTAISFRTDGRPLMTTGSTVGHIAMWDLEKRRLCGLLQKAHLGPVTGVKWLPSQPLIVTSSSDNTIKVWILDQRDDGARILRERSGHSAPPTMIRFSGVKRHEILSAGQDSTLRSFSIQHVRHNRNFGRASYDKAKTKLMPAIVSFSSEHSRSSDWDCILACHRGERTATTWSYAGHTMGKYRLLPRRFTKDEELYKTTCALCSTITSCGNFCLIGYTSGHVDLFNMQSGIHRGSFGSPTAHSSSVRGVKVGALNQCVITAGADAFVKFWRFKQRTYITELLMDAPIAHMELHRDSGLLALALDDFSVSLLDVDTRKVVRVLLGHVNRINDMAFRADARWLVTASMDCSLKIWDICTGGLIDTFTVGDACTSLCLSDNGEYLATTHVNDLGVYVWSNMSLYEHIHLHPLPSDYEPQLLDLPAVGQCTVEPHDTVAVNGSCDGSMPQFISAEQISDELVTLSLLPNSRWLNLLNLDLIKVRNKPVMPPKTRKATSFFIPTVPGLEPRFAPQPVDGNSNKKDAVPRRLVELSEFGSLLAKTDDKESYLLLLRRLEEMGPSGIDKELTTLAPEQGGDLHVMSNFLKLILCGLSTKKHFQTIQAYLSLFVKTHGEVLLEVPNKCRLLSDLYEEQTKTWSCLQDKISHSLCLVNFLKSSTV